MNSKQKILIIAAINFPITLVAIALGMYFILAPRYQSNVDICRAQDDTQIQSCINDLREQDLLYDFFYNLDWLE